MMSLPSISESASAVAEKPSSAEDRPSSARISPLVWILLAGAVLRLVLWLWFQGLPHHIHDEHDYHQIAVNLVQHGEFAFVPGQLTSLRPPLYPFLLAGIYSVFGVENYDAVRLLQALLSLITVVIAYRLGTVLYSRRVGLWLAGFVCSYPSLLGFNNLILTETLFTFLLLLFCLLTVVSLQRSSLLCLGLAGVVLGLAALSRSVVWLFPVILGLFLLAAWKGHVLHRLVAVAVLVAAFALTIAPWSVRNTLLQETFVTIDVMGGRNFMMGNYQHTFFYRSWDTISLEGEKAWHHEVKLAYPPPPEGWTQGQVDKLALRQGLKFVKENPGLTLLRDLVKFFDFWGLERELVAGAAQQFFGPISRPVIALLAVLIFGSYALAFFSGFFGLFGNPPQDWRAHIFLLLVVMFICGMHTLVFGHSRYHLPLMPIILLYSAAAVVSVRSLWHHRARWPFRLACCACTVFFLSWVWLGLAVDLPLFMNALHVNH